ncbi:sensor histidine kinase KdpD [Ruminococcus flavefaciens]|uniref:sensor histidine kinase n=1 Tax=Ruminococcus flavefaciens TaxID=1265 RepID=UPI0026EA95A8|nr:HAMP domain-containing sensor histidine kinase [Ruminococcus flavefaciens]
MKKLICTLVIMTAVFTALIIGFNIGFRKVMDEQLKSFNVTINRINREISDAAAESEASPEKIIADRTEQWKKTYGSSVPESIVFIPLNNSDRVFYAAVDKRCAVCSIYGKDEQLAGFVKYTCSDSIFQRIKLAVNIMLAVCFALLTGAVLFIHFAVFKPFRRLSEYPERLARLRDIQKLPETKSRYFGKYIWGMNMLTDVLAASSHRIHILEGEHQKLVSSIAHGVKTPVANIRLYTDAVRTGLYSDTGMSSDIADKIDSNTAKIESMAAELMTASEATNDGYDFEKSLFPLSELADLIRSEYTDRMALLRIPFTVECEGSPIMESDKYALYRAVSQLLENALKYGDGSGITVKLMKQDEAFCISVRDKGELLSENELPYVFRSYWRGSNAADKSGCGIGLYVVHETAKALGGSVHVRRIEETSEMEFVIFIEQ